MLTAGEFVQSDVDWVVAWAFMAGRGNMGGLFLVLLMVSFVLLVS
jgi:hypothetical protein